MLLNALPLLAQLSFIAGSALSGSRQRLAGVTIGIEASSGVEISTRKIIPKA